MHPMMKKLKCWTREGDPLYKDNQITNLLLLWVTYPLEVARNLIDEDDTLKKEMILNAEAGEGTPVANIECLEEDVNVLEGKGQVETKMCSVDYNYNERMKDSEVDEHDKVGNLTLAAESCKVLRGHR